MIKIILFLLIFLSVSLLALEKKPEADAILKEGMLLYRLEKASWFGTDDFMEHFKPDSLGGYLSYETENHLINTIFYNRFDRNKIIARYQFDSIPKKKPLSIDKIHSFPTPKESYLIKLREDAVQSFAEDKEGFYKLYKNTSFNMIPIITDSIRKVIILTAPQSGTDVLLGNDYILEFDDTYKLVKKDKIHEALIKLPFKSKEKIEATVHTHVLSDFISSTDICTLMLYRDFLEWNTHYVMSQKFVSVFYLKIEKLDIFTKEEWEFVKKMLKYERK